ncbi:hypothetical protein F2P81_017489 [Scophthalmus maximus]|uniref:Uncharacterized protein n=1 Tax=Scophthalmus maximus TaxID=52904 RepID=A0A6A4SEU8_SCOMX|nr:hypothetical protein F2P81_017489 [Scophthalmus maximus]
MSEEYSEGRVTRHNQRTQGWLFFMKKHASLFGCKVDRNCERTMKDTMKQRPRNARDVIRGDREGKRFGTVTDGFGAQRKRLAQEKEDKETQYKLLIKLPNIYKVTDDKCTVHCDFGDVQYSSLLPSELNVSPGDSKSTTGSGLSLGSTVTIGAETKSTFVTGPRLFISAKMPINRSTLTEIMSGTMGTLACLYGPKPIYSGALSPAEAINLRPFDLTVAIDCHRK